MLLPIIINRRLWGFIPLDLEGRFKANYSEQADFLEEFPVGFEWSGAWRASFLLDAATSLSATSWHDTQHVLEALAGLQHPPPDIFGSRCDGKGQMVEETPSKEDGGNGEGSDSGGNKSCRNPGQSLPCRGIAATQEIGGDVSDVVSAWRGGFRSSDCPLLVELSSPSWLCVRLDVEGLHLPD